jgi:hypothetical protein
LGMFGQEFFQAHSGFIPEGAEGVAAFNIL